MEFDISRLMLNVTLMWGDDTTDVNAQSSARTSSVLSSERIEEFVLKSSLSSPVPFGHFIYKDSRKYGDIANAVDIPLVYAKISVCMKGGLSSDDSSDVYHDEFFNELCLITGMSIVDDSDGESVSFKINFELADYLNFTSNIKPFSTYSSNSDTSSADKVISSLFGSAGLGDRLDQKTLTIKPQISFVTTENSTLLSSLKYVLRDILFEDFGNTNEKSFTKIRYNYTTHKYELWKMCSFGTNAGISYGSTNDVYDRDVMFANVDVIVKDSNNSNRILLMSGMNESLIPQMCAVKTLYGYNYGKSNFSISKHETPENTFLAQSNPEFNNSLYKKFSTIKGNSMMVKDINFIDAIRNGNVELGTYDMIDNIIMNSRYINYSSDVVLKRKAGDTMFVELNNSGGTDYMFMNGVYLITESVHKFTRKGKEPKFTTHVNLFTPYTHSDSVKLTKEA